MLAECGQCGWRGEHADCDYIGDETLRNEIKPGDVMPHGQCPRCGAFCYKAKPMKVEADTLVCLRINGTPWFDKPEVATWRDDPDVATWNRDKDFNRDTFTVYDHGEGPDKDDMPKELWYVIASACEGRGIEHAVIWLADLGA